MVSSENNTSPKHNIINFDVTKKMNDAGISHFYLKNNDFVIGFGEGGRRCFPFHSKIPSVSEIMSKMYQKLKNDPVYDSLKAALPDIENQLLERSDDIFSSNNTKESNNYNAEDDKYKAAFITEVTNKRKYSIESKLTYEDWMSLVAQKYQKLEEVVGRNFPNAWPLLQFCLAVKFILSIDGCTLPFMGGYTCNPIFNEDTSYSAIPQVSSDAL
jgi:hypothetical protein